MSAQDGRPGVLALYVRLTDTDGKPRLVNMGQAVAVHPRKEGGCTLLRIAGGQFREWLAVQEGIDTFAHLTGFIPLRFGSPLGWGDVIDGMANMAYVAEFKPYGTGGEKSSVTFVETEPSGRKAGLEMVCRGTLDEILERMQAGA